MIKVVKVCPCSLKVPRNAWCYESIIWPIWPLSAKWALLTKNTEALLWAFYAEFQPSLETLIELAFLCRLEIIILQADRPLMKAWPIFPVFTVNKWMLQKANWTCLAGLRPAVHRMVYTFTRYATLAWSLVLAWYIPHIPHLFILSTVTTHYYRQCNNHNLFYDLWSLSDLFHHFLSWKHLQNNLCPSNWPQSETPSHYYPSCQLFIKLLLYFSSAQCHAFAFVLDNLNLNEIRITKPLW